MVDENKVFIASKTVKLSETSTYLTLRNRLCYYGEPNLNNVCLPVDDALEKAQTLVGMPVVAKYKVDEKGNPDLGGHEISVNAITKEVKFGTENIGVHTAVEIKDDTVSVKGVTKTLPCLFADLRIWTRNKNVTAAIKRLFDEGKLTNSWELLVSSYEFDNGIKNLKDYQFEASAMLGSRVTPSYAGCATTLSVASTEDAEGCSQEQIIAEALAIDVAERTEEDEMKKDKNLPLEDVIQVANQVTPEGGDPVVVEPTNAEVEQTETTEEHENASLTERDLRVKLAKACEAKLGEYCWLAFHLPVERVVWCERCDRKSELDYVVFTYEVVDDTIVVSEPVEKKLPISITEIDTTVASKNDALAEANNTINSLKDKIAALQEYKQGYEQQLAEKAEEEKRARKEALVSYALKSGLITQEETADENSEVGKMISELDETGVKSVIAERFVESIAKDDTTTTQKDESSKPETLRASIDDEEVVTYKELIHGFIKMKK